MEEKNKLVPLGPQHVEQPMTSYDALEVKSDWGLLLQKAGFCVVSIGPILFVCLVGWLFLDLQF